MAASLLITLRLIRVFYKEKCGVGFFAINICREFQSGSKVTIAESWFFSFPLMKLSAALGGVDFGENSRSVSGAQRGGRNRSVNATGGEGAELGVWEQVRGPRSLQDLFWVCD